MGLTIIEEEGGTSGFGLEYQFGKFVVLESNRPVNATTNQLNPTRERHLLLKIDNLSLQPGEKNHYTVANKQVWNWQPRPTNNMRQFLQVNLAKGVDLHPFVCKTPLEVLDNEPLLVSSDIARIEGIHPSQMAFYNINNAARAPKHQSAINFLIRRGLQYIVKSPIAKTVENRKPIYKNSKSFDIGSGWNNWHYLNEPKVQLSATSDPSEYGQETLPGIGYRIRYKLPGNADKVVLEQFNLRALVQSYQDGFGDNWKEEKNLWDQDIVASARNYIIELILHPFTPINYPPLIAMENKRKHKFDFNLAVVNFSTSMTLILP